MEWPRVQVTSSKSQVEYKFVNGGWLPALLSYLILAAIFLPYFIVLCRGTLNPLLPFVSQAAGSPPQSGIFCIFLVLSSLVAFVGLHLLHMGLRVRKNRLEDGARRAQVALLNRVLLIPGHVGILGIVTVAAYPLDFHRHNEDWWQVTIIPHLTGAISLFVGGVSFCALFTYITTLLEPPRTRLLCARIFLIGLILGASALQGYTVGEGFMEEYSSESRLSSCLMEKVEYNQAYIVSSICEWVLLVSFTLFFMTIREEAQHFHFTMAIQVDDESPLEHAPVEKVPIRQKDENHNVGEEKVKQDILQVKS